MVDTVLEFVIRTLKEGKGAQELARELELLNTEYRDVNQSADKTNQTLKEVNQTVDKNKQAIVESKSAWEKFETIQTGIRSALGNLQTVLNAVKGAVDQTVGAFVSYAIEADKGARLTGMGVEEYSRFVQVADDVGISQQAVNTAFEAASRKGIATNIEGIGKLSDQYLKLEPGLERSKFLMDNFGRSGVDLARVMELGSEKIKENSAAIEDGLVITEEAALKAEALRKANDDLNDSILAVKLSIGQELIPFARQLINVLLSLKSGTNELTKTLAGEADQILRTSSNFDEFSKRTIASMRAAGVNVDETDKVLLGLMDTMWRAEHPLQMTANKFDAIAEAARNVDLPVQKITGKFDQVAESSKGVNKEFSKTDMYANNLGVSFRELYDKTIPLTQASIWLKDNGIIPLDISFQGVTKSAAQLADEMLNDKWWQGELHGRLSDLNDLINGKLGPAFDEFTKKQKELKEEIGNTEAVLATYANLKYMTPAQQAEFDKLTGNLATAKSKLSELDKAFEETARRMMFNMLQQAAAVDGLTTNEVNNLTKLALHWGLIDTKTAEVTMAISKNIAELDTENIDGLLNTLEGIMGIPDDKDINVTVTTVIDPADLAMLTDLMNPDVTHKTIQVKVETKETKTTTTTTTPPPRPGGEIRGEGGTVIIGNPYIVGDKGPELFVPWESGDIIPNDKLKAKGSKTVLGLTGIGKDQPGDYYDVSIINYNKIIKSGGFMGEGEGDYGNMEINPDKPEYYPAPAPYMPVLPTQNELDILAMGSGLYRGAATAMTPDDLFKIWADKQLAKRDVNINITVPDQTYIDQIARRIAQLVK